MGRREFALLGVVLVLLLAGCGGDDNAPNADLPSTPEEASSVVVRVSGTEGTAYSGDYGSIEGTLQPVDGALGDEPTEYEVEVEEGVSDGVIAGFQKTQPGGEKLKVEVLADDQVVVESTTYAEFGVANADWIPQAGLPEEISLEEDSLEEDSP